MSAQKRVERDNGLSKVFWYAAEGARTEHEYLKILAKIYPHVRFNEVEGSRGDPKNLLARMNRHVRSRFFQPSAVCILMGDRDTWDDRFIEEILEWEAEDPLKRIYLLSNPCFEMCLAWHFQDCQNFYHCNQFRSKLHSIDKRFSGKSIPKGVVSRSHIENACICSRNRSSFNWRMPGYSRLHRLIEEIEKR